MNTVKPEVWRLNGRMIKIIQNFVVILPVYPEGQMYAGAFAEFVSRIILFCRVPLLLSRMLIALRVSAHLMTSLNHIPLMPTVLQAGLTVSSSFSLISELSYIHVKER